MASENVLKQKEEEVKKLAEKLKEAKVILLTDYRGINVTDVTKLTEYKKEIDNLITKKAKMAGESSPKGSYLRQLIEERKIMKIN